VKSYKSANQPYLVPCPSGQGACKHKAVLSSNRFEEQGRVSLSLSPVPCMPLSLLEF
jgi:hypothetical protein